MGISCEEVWRDVSQIISMRISIPSNERRSIGTLLSAVIAPRSLMACAM